MQDSVFNGLLATTNFGIPEDKLVRFAHVFATTYACQLPGLP